MHSNVIHMPPVKAPMQRLSLDDQPPISMRNLTPREIWVHCPICSRVLVCQQEDETQIALEIHYTLKHSEGAA